MAFGIKGRTLARGWMLLAALGTATVIVAAVVADSPAASGCDRVAAPSGSDSAAGSAAAPYRTAGKLADSLQPGQTGCLRAGTYEQDVAIARGGSAGSPITLTSYPNERATVRGRFRVKDSANFVTIEDLDLDGRNPADTLPSPSVYGNDVVFRGNDVTNYHTGICFLLGSNDYGRAERVTIEGNRIHDCGVLPAQNHHHGIYIEHADNTRVVDNWIYDNADRGVQMFPDSQGAYIARNVIDGNGQGVSYARDSANNVVEHNVVSNSVLRWNIEDWELYGGGQRRAVELRVDHAHRLVCPRGRHHGQPRLHRGAEPDRRSAVREPHGKELPPRGGQPVHGAAGRRRNATGSGSRSPTRARSRTGAGPCTGAGPATRSGPSAGPGPGARP